jgi:hypothetical protein
MVRHTRKRRVLRKRTRKQHGGLTNAQKAAMASLGSGLAKRGGPPPPSPPVLTGAPNGANAAPAEPNDPLAKYRKMKKLGLNEGAIKQKMAVNGKSQANINIIFPPGSVVASSKNNTVKIKKRTNFTLDELNILKDYLDKSIIIEQALRSDIDPHILYSDVSDKELRKAADEISKPDLPAKKQVVIPLTANGQAKAMKNNLQIRILGAVEQDIKFFTTLTAPEKQALLAAEEVDKLIRSIKMTTIPTDIAMIRRKKAENKKITINDIAAVLSNLKQIDDYKLQIEKILKPYKEKLDFLNGNPAVKKFKIDKDGRLPNGWFIEVDSQKKTMIYRNKYTNLVQIERPTEEALRPTELPEGWGIGEDETDVWYVNLITNKSQWTLPTEPAQLFDTTGWTQTKNKDGSYIWYMPYQNSDTWFVMRNTDKTWYENPSNANGVKYNEPPF